MMRESERIIGPEEIKKFREKVMEKIEKTIERLQSDGFAIEIMKDRETPETLTLRTMGKDGKERIMGFMKMSGIEKVIEERIKNPDGFEN